MGMHRTPRCVLSLVLVGAVCVAGEGSETSKRFGFYVAPDGHDDQPGTKREPFATLLGARNAVRKLIARGLTGDVTVWLRDGMYRITEPVIFGPDDSGTDEFSITYAAYSGEQPVISGGRVITGWTAQPNGTWTTSIADEGVDGRGHGLAGSQGQ